MRKYQWIIAVLLALAISSCQPDYVGSIAGSWQIDSVYDYYNGFGFTNRAPSPREVFDYQADHIVFRKGMGEQLEYRYQIKDSILTFTDQTGRPGDDYIIIQLDQEQLALKKNKTPLFGGKNQLRYEIRFFSRISPIAK